MSDSHSFHLLHEGVQRWIWGQNWHALRDIQEASIEPILNGDRDVVISASTAAGKTEAAFLPACSYLATHQPKGIGILYISPLKALINDQYRRLQSLCELLDVQVTPWHGDVSRSKKDKQKKKPEGILLITPESLESLLMNEGGWCRQAFAGLSHIIIDEYHAFIGTERGCQLQSLMHRLEFLLQKIVPRIALSATLGDLKLVAQTLRTSGELPCEIIESTAIKSDLKVQLRGYLTPATDDGNPSGFEQITSDLYSILRGKSHLVFANSRKRTEEVAANLADRCEMAGVPNEFFPHHGSLSKELRESLESRLLQGKYPTTAVCTMTLELGIDIGSVDSIAQVTAPHSVASLRQRLGRSGRRGEAAVLRMFIEEDEVTSKTHLLDKLRLETIQCIAMVNLLLKKWYEPPATHQYHFSTLVQQTLSVIAQYGGVRAGQLWSLLCKTGPFSLVDQNLYGSFLRALGAQDLITQTHDGQITLGSRGERYAGHYSFYCAFNTPEEYRLESDGRVLGTVPIDMPLMVGQHLIFAGKRWEILNVDTDKKLIILTKAKGGKPPKFGGSGQMVHDIVRQEMYSIYKREEEPVYLDANAQALFREGIENFRNLGLGRSSIVEQGNGIHLLPWLGDRVTNTIVMLLRREGISADCFGGIIDVENCDAPRFFDIVDQILSGDKPTPFELAGCVEDTIIEKHDSILPREIRDLNYGLRYFDVDGAWAWLNSSFATWKKEGVAEL